MEGPAGSRGVTSHMPPGFSVLGGFRRVVFLLSCGFLKGGQISAFPPIFSRTRQLTKMPIPVYNKVLAFMPAERGSNTDDSQ